MSRSKLPFGVQLDSDALSGMLDALPAEDVSTLLSRYSAVRPGDPWKGAEGISNNQDAYTKKSASMKANGKRCREEDDEEAPTKLARIDYEEFPPSETNECVEPLDRDDFDEKHEDESKSDDTNNKEKQCKPVVEGREIRRVLEEFIQPEEEWFDTELTCHFSRHQKELKDDLDRNRETAAKKKPKCFSEGGRKYNIDLTNTIENYFVENFLNYTSLKMKFRRRAFRTRSPHSATLNMIAMDSTDKDEAYLEQMKQDEGLFYDMYKLRRVCYFMMKSLSLTIDYDFAKKSNRVILTQSRINKLLRIILENFLLRQAHLEFYIAMENDLSMKEKGAKPITCTEFEEAQRRASERQARCCKRPIKSKFIEMLPSKYAQYKKEYDAIMLK